MGTSELMVAAARSQRSPFSSPVRVRLEGGVLSPLGKRKQIVGLITHEQWLSGQRGVRSWVVYPETATSATWTLTQHGSLSPGLCRSLVKESYSSSRRPPQSSALLLGYKERIIRQGRAICEVIGTIKPETEEQIGRESSGNYMRLGMLVLIIGYR